MTTAAYNVFAVGLVTSILLLISGGLYLGLQFSLLGKLLTAWRTSIRQQLRKSSERRQRIVNAEIQPARTIAITVTSCPVQSWIDADVSEPVKCPRPPRPNPPSGGCP